MITGQTCSVCGGFCSWTFGVRTKVLTPMMLYHFLWRQELPPDADKHGSPIGLGAVRTKVQTASQWNVGVWIPDASSCSVEVRLLYRMIRERRRTSFLVPVQKRGSENKQGVIRPLSWEACGVREGSRGVCHPWCVSKDKRTHPSATKTADK